MMEEAGVTDELQPWVIDAVLYVANTEAPMVEISQPELKQRFAELDHLPLLPDRGQSDMLKSLDDLPSIQKPPTIPDTEPSDPHAVAVVINNNQSGWRNIVATRPNVTLPVGTELYVAASEAAQEVEKFDGSWRIKNIGEDPVFDSICVNVALLLGIRTNMDAPWFGPNGRAISENIAANLKLVSERLPRTPVAWAMWNDAIPPQIIDLTAGDIDPSHWPDGTWQPLYAD